MDTKRVFIVGGAGFLGYHTTLAMVAKGYDVTILSLPPITRSLFPATVKCVEGDLMNVTDRELLDMLAGQDAVVFAAGADDRVTPKKPAYAFFTAANIDPTVRLFSLARQAGVKKAVLFSSYFAHFDRIWPEMHLADHHPYIRARREQEARAIEVGGPDLAVVALEFPYIFGTMPGKKPLWTPLLQYLKKSPIIFFLKGGTTMVSVEHVAESVIGAIEYGEHGGRYVVSDENMTWKTWMTKLLEIMEMKKRIITLPNWLVWPGLWFVKMRHALQGREGGLDPTHFLALQTRETFFDAEETRRVLHYGSGGLEESLRATVKSALSE